MSILLLFLILAFIVLKSLAVMTAEVVGAGISIVIVILIVIIKKRRS